MSNTTSTNMNNDTDNFTTVSHMKKKNIAHFRTLSFSSNSNDGQSQWRNDKNNGNVLNQHRPKSGSVDLKQSNNNWKKNSDTNTNTNNNWKKNDINNNNNWKKNNDINDKNDRKGYSNKLEIKLEKEKEKKNKLEKKRCQGLLEPIKKEMESLPYSTDPDVIKKQVADITSKIKSLRDQLTTKLLDNGNQKKSDDSNNAIIQFKIAEYYSTLVKYLRIEILLCLPPIVSRLSIDNYSPYNTLCWNKYSGSDRMEKMRQVTDYLVKQGISFGQQNAKDETVADALKKSTRLTDEEKKIIGSYFVEVGNVEDTTCVKLMKSMLNKLTDRNNEKLQDEQRFILFKNINKVTGIFFDYMLDHPFKKSDMILSYIKRIGDNMQFIFDAAKMANGKNTKYIDSLEKTSGQNISDNVAETLYNCIVEKLALLESEKESDVRDKQITMVFAIFGELNTRNYYVGEAYDLIQSNIKFNSNSLKNVVRLVIHSKKYDIKIKYEIAGLYKEISLTLRNVNKMKTLNAKEIRKLKNFEALCLDCLGVLIYEKPKELIDDIVITEKTNLKAIDPRKFNMLQNNPLLIKLLNDIKSSNFEYIASGLSIDFDKEVEAEVKIEVEADIKLEVEFKHQEIVENVVEIPTENTPMKKDFSKISKTILNIQKIKQTEKVTATMLDEFAYALISEVKTCPDDIQDFLMEIIQATMLDLYASHHFNIIQEILTYIAYEYKWDEFGSKFKITIEDITLAIKSYKQDAIDDCDDDRTKELYMRVFESMCPSSKNEKNSDLDEKHDDNDEEIKIQSPQYSIISVKDSEWNTFTQNDSIYFYHKPTGQIYDSVHKGDGYYIPQNVVSLEGQVTVPLSLLCPVEHLNNQLTTLCLEANIVKN